MQARLDEKKNALVAECRVSTVCFNLTSLQLTCHLGAIWMQCCCKLWRIYANLAAHSTDAGQVTVDIRETTVSRLTDVHHNGNDIEAKSRFAADTREVLALQRVQAATRKKPATN
jgi:hypothetical protein